MSVRQDTISSRAVGSLQGVRIIDVTSNVAGPFATQVLGDLGADVIKVERPSGDDCRGWGPPFCADGTSAMFSGLNRNKRSVVLDLTADDDRAHFEALIRTADVVIQSVRPGTFEGLGYGWNALRQLTPDVVYCELSGFGHGGPRQNQPAYDPLIQAFSGIMSVTGEDGGMPVRVPVSVLDQGTGMWAALAILDALHSRERSGRGAHLQVSLLETALAWQPLQILGYLATGAVPTRHGSGAASIVPYEAYPSQDGYLMLAAGNQRLWVRLCDAIGRPELVADPRFADNASRVRNRAPLFDELTEVFGTHATDHWVGVLEAAGVPASAIHTVDHVLEDEQVLATGMVGQHSDGTARYDLIESPISVDRRRYAVRHLPPAMGAHTDEVLAEAAAILAARDTTVSTAGDDA